MLGFNVFAADSDDEARVLATSMQQAFVNLRTRPAGASCSRRVPGYLESLGPQERAMLEQVLSCSAIGAPGHGAARHGGVHRAHRRRRADGHLADLRPRGAVALVRDHRGGARRQAETARSGICKYFYIS